MRKMNVNILPLLLLQISTAVGATYHTYRVTDPEGKANLRKAPDAKAAVLGAVDSGTCLVGLEVAGGWSQVGGVKNQKYVSGFMHRSRLVEDPGCGSRLTELAMCELMEGQLDTVQGFEGLELWRRAYFVKRCDDGGHAEVLSDFVSRRLAEHWDTEILALQSSGMSDTTRALVYRHLDETMNLDQSVEMRKRLKSCKDDPHHVCRKIRSKLQELAPQP